MDKQELMNTMLSLALYCEDHGGSELGMTVEKNGILVKMKFEYDLEERNFREKAKRAFKSLMGVDKNEVCEVKRAAKVGEWVKVVRAPINPTEEFKMGDILQIVAHPSSVMAGAYYKDQVGKFLLDFEYVVLENYQPPKEKEKPKLLNTKIVFGKETYLITAGKVYEIKDGIMFADDERDIGNQPFQTIEDVKAFFGGKETGGFNGVWWNRDLPLNFIEIVD